MKSLRKTLWGSRRREWKWRLANGYRDKGDECPMGLEYRWDGALTTTLDLAEDLASLTLDGMTEPEGAHQGKGK